MPPSGGPPRPVSELNRLPAQYRLRYEPLDKGFPEDARVTAVLGTGAKDAPELTVLDPKPADQPAEWTAPARVSIIALVYGPQGLSAGKLKSLSEKQPELLTQLAGYAEQSAKVEALVGALARSERGETTLDAALAGFSSRYGVAIPKLDPKSTTDQQASTLLRALLPAMSSYDPLISTRATVMQQSAGLATSIAAMFWGNPVGLAAGGAALFQNLRSVLFPGTEFRSAFAQPSADGALALCGSPQPPKSRTRLAFLWAQQLPDVGPPALSLLENYHLPLGVKAAVSITGAGLPLAMRLTGWRLIRNGAEYRVSGGVTGDRLTLDLQSSNLPGGEYAIGAEWDWEIVRVAGTLYLHELEDLGTASVAPATVLVEATGKTTLTLNGPDFQFLEKVSLGDTELPFRLPNGRRAGPQRAIEIDVDTTPLRRGAQILDLIQPNGMRHPVHVEVLPPNPEIRDLPLQLNSGEQRQAVLLRGTGLDRIDSIEVSGAWVELGSGSDSERTARIHWRDEPERGAVLAARVAINRVPQTMEVPNFATVAGPRPRIQGVSAAAAPNALLRENELATGAATSFSISVANLEGPPALEMFCQEGDERKRLSLRPGDTRGLALLEVAGGGLLYLSADPGAVGRPGCLLAAEVVAASGRSDAIVFGRVVRVPRIDSFELTDEKLAEGVYAGVLTGTALETIEKAGWNADEGIPVQSIPTPAGNEPTRQRLKVALPWPSPAPHSPVYVWLRGEAFGRPTGVKY
jgi:hypothetical protein